MVQERARPNCRDDSVDRLGGPPAVYVAAPIVMCVITARSWVCTTSFVVILCVTVAIALRSLRQNTRATAV
jgi:hypothetical protein